jgi:hypothetical protein
MKFDKDMLMKIALIVFGMLAGIAGYEVVQEDDSVTVALPVPADEAKTEEAPAEPEAPTEE